MQKSGEGKKGILAVVLEMLLGPVVGVLVTLLVLYILALLIYSEKIAESLSDVVVLSSALLGACVGSVITVGRQQGRGMISFGTISGLIYYALVLGCGAFGASDGVLLSKIVKIGICSIMGGLLGGTLWLHRGRHKKAKRSR